MKNEKVLFIDDEEHILDAIRRQLRKKFHIKTATSAQIGLEILRLEGPFAVVVSDLHMPGINGIAFLSEVKNRYPETVRVMLSGNADLQTAIEAVNNGQIFRFLTKPCAVNALTNTLNLGIRHHQLEVSERELLNKTLKGSIQMMSELLSLADPNAFSCGYRIRKTVSHIVKEMGLTSTWKYDVAALLSQVGCIAIPPDILKKIRAFQPLSAKEEKIYHNHPLIGAKLVSRIPRLFKISQMIGGQLESYANKKVRDDKNDDTLLGASILRVSIDYDRLISGGYDHKEAVRELRLQEEMYHPEMLTLLESASSLQQESKYKVNLHFDDLLPGMVAAEDIITQNGSVIIEKDQEITWSVIQGLLNFIDHIGIQEPIAVWSNGENKIGQKNRT